MKIEDIFEWEDKDLEQMSLNDLSDLMFVLDALPIGINYTVEVNGKKYKYLEDYIEERTNEFFNASEEDYKKIVGKCFINKEVGVAIKVVALSDDEPINFLFEKFIQYDDGSWHISEYNWLQETAKGKYADPKYLKWCLTSETDMNINAEEMFMLGKDGQLYVDVSCGGDYDIYGELSAAAFQLIRDEAIKSDGEYYVKW